ncbi:uncharacterized protein PGTG_12635 [Puccinia graminis f. sp. tritici CRL 75-36-700-3]|uniref:Uncharacterized protein n=1 Tax=Puccinia graminis f. sp. tritici (strain CRL 75-36-700-3 / race SCCL) TaxID=418459 RepID=E3KRG9_PUCGT|nr:uncharacterized protein PGTG_12635 [Puccinia graminis f. sp. tritici CRL 75-36-700-3]EFP86894.1 hypothetical protein PGTG_12635 [Puccinia graminis f. sp. tritici CRL 75-36-700-3]
MWLYHYTLYEPDTYSNSKEPSHPVASKPQPTNHQRCNRCNTLQINALNGGKQEHHKEFPVLASLACSETLANVEQCFSTATNVCGHGQGGFSPQTIEGLVSSHQWLKKGLKDDEEPIGNCPGYCLSGLDAVGRK